MVYIGTKEWIENEVSSEMMEVLKYFLTMAFHWIL